MIKIGIYKITIGDYIYIGQSIDIDKRFNTYQRYWNCKSQLKLYNCIVKHGIENCKFEIVEECDKEKLNEREVYWMKFYDTFETKHGLNLQLGGRVRIVSQETKEKIRLANLGKVSKNKGKKNTKRSLVRKKRVSATDETRLKMSLAKKGHIAWNKGKRWKKKNYTSRKGIKLSKEHIDKIKQTKLLNRKEISCPHCTDKSVVSNLMQKWHFANCKKK